jgi:hypothetical protein
MSAGPLLPRAAGAVALALAAPALSGCWAWGRVDGGLVTPTTLCRGCAGSTANMHVAGGEDNNRIGMDLAIRTKFTPDTQQLAFGLGLAATGKADPVAPYFVGGIHTLQFEDAFGDFAFGMGSPYAEIGVRAAVVREGSSGIDVLLGTAIEYDVRFTHQPSQGFWSFKVGMGFEAD